MVEAEENSHVLDNTPRPPNIPVAMSWKSAVWIVVGLVVLLYGTVLVFLAFDRNSNSVSDTVRPFVITMGPVWALAIAAARVLLRKT
jgi:hypothetical protein